MATRKKAAWNDEFERAEQAAKSVFSKTKLRPRIALVLGSGLGAFADEFASSTKIPYGKIPHFPQSTAIGHVGQLVIGKVGDIAVAGMQGRVHLYEGYSIKDVIFPIRVFARMGIKAVILTNAAGGIKPEFSQGRLVVIKDHINLQGVNPSLRATAEFACWEFPASRTPPREFSTSRSTTSKCWKPPSGSRDNSSPCSKQ